MILKVIYGLSVFDVYFREFEIFQERVKKGTVGFVWVFTVYVVGLRQEKFVCRDGGYGGVLYVRASGFSCRFRLGDVYQFFCFDRLEEIIGISIQVFFVFLFDWVLGIVVFLVFSDRLGIFYRMIKVEINEFLLDLEDFKVDCRG